MWNAPTEELLSRIPRLYTNLNVPLQDRLIYLHLFFGGSEWFIAEISEGNEFMWGWVILDFDDDGAQWRVVSLSALKSIRIGILEVSNDRLWEVRPALEVYDIRMAHPQWRLHHNKQHAMFDG